MAEFVNVSLLNDTLEQHVLNATDDVLGEQVLTNVPLEGGESTPIRLVADPDGKGRMTCGFRGGVEIRRDDLIDNDVVRVN